MHVHLWVHKYVSNYMVTNFNSSPIPYECQKMRVIIKVSITFALSVVSSITFQWYFKKVDSPRILYYFAFRFDFLWWWKLSEGNRWSLEGKIADIISLCRDIHTVFIPLKSQRQKSKWVSESLDWNVMYFSGSNYCSAKLLK